MVRHDHLLWDVLIGSSAYAEGWDRYPTDQLPLPELRATSELFENNMMSMSDDGSMVCATGATFGGGGTVNWCASLQVL